MTSDQKRRLGMGQGALSEKVATHKLVVTRKLHVEPKQRTPDAEEQWQAFQQARKNAGIPWCWVLAQLSK